MTRRGSSQVFVGRRAELDRLEEAFGRAAMGRPSLVLLAGEAGVGKSRLVSEFLARVEATGASTIIGGCLDLGEGGLPYAPFVEALRALARRLDPAEREALFGPSAGVLGGLIPDLRPAGVGLEHDDPSDAAGRLAQLFDAVLAVLGRLSHERPLALVLEDIHWADGSTRDLIRFIVRNMRDERLLLLATYRSDDLHRRHPLMPLLGELERADRVERVELRPFERDELREQLSDILGEAPSTALVDALLERSDGLPFYVEELVGHDARDPAELPATLRDILGSRLATLSPRSLALVHAAAVIGGRFPHERLAAMFDEGEDELLAALHGAIDARILVPIDDPDGPAYMFRHALLREAAYDELLPAERVRLHARLADHLEASIRSSAAPDPSILADFALHAYQAHDQPRALSGSIRALRAFIDAAAYREALGHAERALELWPRVDEARERAGMDHPELLVLAGRMASATNHPKQAMSLTQEALLEGIGEMDRDRRAELLATLYLIAWEAGDPETSAAVIEEAYRLVEAAEPSRTKALVVLWLGGHRWNQDQLRASLRLLEQSMAMSDILGDVSAWATGASSAAHTLADLGWVVRAAEMVDRSMVRVIDFDGRVEYINADLDRSIALWTTGRFGDSARIAAAGLARATRYGWEARFGSAFRACLADAFFELGRYDEVEEVTRPGIAGDGIRYFITWTTLTLARATVAQGRLDEAHRLMDDLERDPAMSESFDALSVVELARADGRFGEVVSRIERSIAHYAGSERVIPLPMLLGAGVGAAADRAVFARNRRRAGDASEAADHARRWLALFRSLVAGTKPEGGAGPFVDALLATAEADMTRLEGPSDPIAWSAVVARWTELAHPHQGASARLRLVEALLDSAGDRGDAASVLREAYETAGALGARLLRAEIEEVARRGRIELGDVGVDPTDDPDEDVRQPVELTARERGVLQLVAEGHTNREIGDRLYISEKTVSVHVSNAMRKLDALSRYEAAASAERLGLL